MQVYYEPQIETFIYAPTEFVMNFEGLKPVRGSSHRIVNCLCFFTLWTSLRLSVVVYYAKKIFHMWGRLCSIYFRCIFVGKHALLSAIVFFTCLAHCVFTPDMHGSFTIRTGFSFISRRLRRYPKHTRSPKEGEKFTAIIYTYRHINLRYWCNRTNAPSGSSIISYLLPVFDKLHSRERQPAARSEEKMILNGMPSPLSEYLLLNFSAIIIFI